MSINVFLSYATVKDLDGTVSDFHKALDQAVKGVSNMESNVFIDRRGIRDGDNWKDKLADELQKASVLVILLSPVWLSREWCRAEYNYFKAMQKANDKKKFVICLEWASTDMSDAINEESKQVLKDLNDLQKVKWFPWLDLKHDRNYKESTVLRKAISDLADAIKYQMKQ